MSPTRYVHNGTSFVQLGAKVSDQFPGALLSDGVTTATSVRAAITCTASATPHTEGTWVEVDASLSAAASGIAVSQTVVTAATNTATSTMLEIGTGAAGSETVWAKIGVGYRRAEAQPLIVPGAIAAGTRVAVRARGVVVSQAVTAVYAFLFVKAGLVLGAPVTFQANAATSRGLTITAPGSLNTKGAWTELVASTAAALSVLHVSPQGAGAASFDGGDLLIDIGVGASGSEVVIIPDIYSRYTSTEIADARGLLTYGVDIPAGSRIAARYARSAVNNNLDLILVGAPPA